MPITSLAASNPVPERKYFAFLSYSHKDTAVVKRLHRELERYRVPARLVGKKTPVFDALPSRIMPVFLDREELPSSADLDSDIVRALEASSCLIVVCSPRAAVSRWVEAEIVAFKRMGRANRVMAVIVDGDPNATDHPGKGLLECFPHALRFRIGEQGEITHERAEPIAPDLRPEGDGWRNVKLKLIAGILGVPFDELRQRESERERTKRQRLAIVIALMLLAALIGGRAVNDYFRHVEAHGYAKRAAIELGVRHHVAAALYAEAANEVDDKLEPVQAMLPELRKAFPKPVATLNSAARSVEHVLFAPDNQTLYGAGYDGALYCWHLDNVDGAPDRFVIGKKALSRLAWQADLQRLVVAGWDASLTLWDPAQARITQRIAAHYKRTRVMGVFVDAARSRIASCGDDGYARLWNPSLFPQVTEAQPIAENVQALELVEHDDFAKSVALSPDGVWIASGGFDERLRLRHVAADQPARVITTTKDSLNAVVFSSDSKLVITGGRAGVLRAYRVDGADDRPVWEIAAHSNRINDLCLDPTGSQVFSASDDGSIRKWSLADQSLLLAVEAGTLIPGQAQDVKFLGVAISADGRLVAGSQSDGKVSIWENQVPSAQSFNDLVPRLAQRVSVRWARGSLIKR